MISFVVATAKNNVMGMNNKLAWHLPQDAKFFRKVTMSGSKTMIMGRKTFESLPKILPGRKHIILTRSKDYQIDDENVLVFNRVEEILNYMDPAEEYFVIGGAEIFKIFFPYADRIYLTEIYEDFEGDTFFPEYDTSEWEITSVKEGTVDEKNKYQHTFFVLDRIRRN